MSVESIYIAEQRNFSSSKTIYTPVQIVARRRVSTSSPNNASITTTEDNGIETILLQDMAAR